MLKRKLSHIDYDTGFAIYFLTFIFGREKKEGTQFFIIRIWLVYAPSEISDAIRKRYNQFVELHEKMLMQGYQELPAFPGKKIFMTDRDTDER